MKERKSNAARTSDTSDTRRTTTKPSPRETSKTVISFVTILNHRHPIGRSSVASGRVARRSASHLGVCRNPVTNQSNEIGDPAAQATAAVVA